MSLVSVKTMFKFVLVIASLGHVVQAANILGIFPMASGSHYILDYKLMKGLADAGHNVIMFTPTAQKTPPHTKGNFTEIILDGFKEDIEKMLVEFDFFGIETKSMFTKLKANINSMIANANKTFYYPELRELLESNKKFDAVIIEHFQNDALKVFGHLLNCPLILLFTIGPNSWINPVVGNPNEMSYIRHFNSPGNPEEPMTFLERSKNFLLHVMDYFLIHYFMLPIHDELIQQAFPGAPRMEDLHTNGSIVLLNSHTSLYPPQPLVPNMIEIGGYHIEPPKKLPQDLQEFLDNATNGVIYFSMGSHLKSKNIPEDKKKILLNVLGKLKEKVIWKFEENLPGKPDNVLIKAWLPQQDILAHPNIKLFITHGGLLSTTETVYHGVPILAIPVFADQPGNAEKAEYAGYALKLSYHDSNFTEDRLSELIEELLNNPKYKENAKMRSKLFHDRPMKPIDTAVYWVEYVIRNNGARHLRVGGIAQSWYEYHLVDVVLFIAFLVLVLLSVSVYLLKKLYRMNCSKNHSKQKIKTH